MNNQGQEPKTIFIACVALGREVAEALEEEPGTFILTDFLIHVWDKFVVQGLFFVKAQEIADWLQLPLVVEHVAYGNLERRLVVIMEGKEQPTASMTLDGFAGGYPVAG